MPLQTDKRGRTHGICVPTCSHGSKTFRAAGRKWSTKLCQHETHQCPT
jgi:hypothetical protein